MTMYLKGNFTEDRFFSNLAYTWRDLKIAKAKAETEALSHRDAMSDPQSHHQNEVLAQLLSAFAVTQ